MLTTLKARIPHQSPVVLSGLSPDLQSMEQIRRIMRPTDVPDQGLLCDLLWSDPDKDTMGWGENDRGVSFTFGAEVVAKFLHKHDLDLICRAHQVCALTFDPRRHSVSVEMSWVFYGLFFFHPHPLPFLRLWKMVTNSLLRGSWWRFFRHRIIVANLTTLGRWWALTKRWCVRFRSVLVQTYVVIV